MVLKFEKFSYLSGRYFWLGSPVRLKALSLVLSLRVDTYQERIIGEIATWKNATQCPKGESIVNDI